MTSDGHPSRSAERATAAGSLHVPYKIRKIRVPRLFPFVILLVLLLPGAALAQFGYPRPYPSYRSAEPDSSLRFSVKPKQAAVYVDGYFAGTVADFSGFHRLRVIPGE